MIDMEGAIADVEETSRLNVDPERSHCQESTSGRKAQLTKLWITTTFLIFTQVRRLSVGDGRRLRATTARLQGLHRHVAVQLLA